MPHKRPSPLVLLLLSLTLDLSAVGCAQKFAATDLGSGACGTQQQKLRPAPRADEGKKVALDPTSLRNILQGKIQAAGTPLVVLTDERCLGEPSPGQTITAGWQPRSLNGQRRPLPLRSRSWTWPDGLSLDDLEQLAEQDPCIRRIGSQIPMRPFSVINDPYASFQPHLASLGFTSTYASFFGAQGITQDVVIAIIDSGVEISHSEFSGALWTNSGEIAGNGIDDDGNGYVDDVNGYNFAADNGDPRPEAATPGDPASEAVAQHGTGVASLAAAKAGNNFGMVGIMGQRAKIMALNVFGPYEATSPVAVEEAIIYAIAQGADVINLSLGGLGRISTTGDLLAEAASAGVVIVAAAGNGDENGNGILLDASDAKWMTPASFGAAIDGMISVGAAATDTTMMTIYSNYSPQFVEMAAPGSDRSPTSTDFGIGMLMLYKTTMLTRSHGTSMAAPLVAGSAALAIGLMRSRGGTPVPAEVEKVLAESATSIPHLCQKVVNGQYLNIKGLYDKVNLNYPAP